MNILVTGANGQLGEEIRRIVEDEIGNGKPDHYIGEKNYYIFTGHNELDITDEYATEKFIRDNFINVIVNCAAYTNVDKAQTDRDAAYNVNAIGAMNLALAAKSVGAVLIHISTDYVFGGKYDTPIPPLSQDAPEFIPVDREKNFYGYSKLIGEHLIQTAGCKYIILRTAWVYSSHHKNFVTTMHRLHKAGTHPKVVNDQIGSPTAAFHLAKFIVHIIEDNDADNRYLSKQGIYNFAGNGTASWYDIARQVFGKDADWVEPCGSSEFPTPVERPKYSVLDVSLTEETFDYGIPRWTSSLIKVLHDIHMEDEDYRRALETANSEYDYGHNVCSREDKED